MKKFTVKQGMRFRPSDEQISKNPHFKDYTYYVRKKVGAYFLVTFWNGIGAGEDLFQKWELEKMILTNPEKFK